MRQPPALLAEDAVATALETLDGWSIAEGKLTKTYVFRDFVQAFGFMTAAALCAERANHHPEWSNAYKTVDISLTTHESGGITQKDLDLATEFEQVAGGTAHE